MNKFIALVGMAGSGKSIVSDELISRGYHFFRFGQITLDIIKERGLEVNEKNERAIREGVREEHGMGAYAILNIPKIDRFLETGSVVGDGLYSWDEYKILKERYGDQLFVVAVYAPPSIRYQRLSTRETSADDKDIRNRKINPEQAKSRDFAEIENIAKAGPIAMADFTINNTGTMEQLHQQMEHIIKQIEK